MSEFQYSELFIGLPMFCLYNVYNPPFLAVCDGKCSSGTRYINESPFYEGRCSCCYPKIVKSKDINLKCQDGSTTFHRITEAAACECRSCGNSAAAPPVELS